MSNSEIDYKGKGITREEEEKREKQRDGQKITSVNYIDNCNTVITIIPV